MAGAYTMELNLEPSQVENQFNEKHYGPASKVVPNFVHKFLVARWHGQIGISLRSY